MTYMIHIPDIEDPIWWCEMPGCSRAHCRCYLLTRFKARVDLMISGVAILDGVLAIEKAAEKIARLAKAPVR